jgi:hypothetical protein
MPLMDEATYQQRQAAMLAQCPNKEIHIPPDLYRIKIIQCEEAISKSSGNPMFTVRGRLIDVDSKPVLKGYVVRKGDSKWQEVRFYAAVGYNPRVHFEAEDLVGQRAYIQVVDETVDGIVRSKIRRWIPRLEIPESVKFNLDDPEPRAGSKASIGGVPVTIPVSKSVAPEVEDMEADADGDDLNMSTTEEELQPALRAIRDQRAQAHRAKDGCTGYGCL